MNTPLHPAAVSSARPVAPPSARIPVLNTLLNLRLAGSVAAATAPARANTARSSACSSRAATTASTCSRPAAARPPTPTYHGQPRRTSRCAPAQLIEIHPDNTPGRTFGVHRRDAEAREPVSTAGNAAFVANVGTLIEPVQNRTQVAQNLKRLPLGLYSHSDQIEQWQTSVPHARSGIGWAGRMVDLHQGAQRRTRPCSMNISLDGSNVWQTGVTVAEYAVNPGNDDDPTAAPSALTGYDADWQQYNDVAERHERRRRQPARAAIHQPAPADLQHAKDAARSDAYDALLRRHRRPLPGDVTFPNTSLGRQLQHGRPRHHGPRRARRGAADVLRQPRRLGSPQRRARQPGRHAARSRAPPSAPSGTQLVALGVQNKVTLFTASDFGRTLTSNGRGSDHAWGGNQFVVGGSVDGKKHLRPVSQPRRQSRERRRSQPARHRPRPLHPDDELRSNSSPKWRSGSA